jgi:hypothetical protein
MEAGPSHALMEISQLLTQTADDFHKMAKKTKLSDSGSTSTAATTTDSDDTGGLVFVGTYLCDYYLLFMDKQYLIGVFSVPFSIFPCADVILARADRIQKSLKSKTVAQKDSDTADIVLVSINVCVKE